MFPHVWQQLTYKMEEDHQKTITGIQEEHRLAIEEHEQAIALLNHDLQERDNRMQAIQYKNVGLQCKVRARDQQIAALQRYYVDYLSNENKNNDISIMVKNNGEAEYLCMSIWRWHGHRRHKSKELQMEIYGMLLLRITSGESIGWLLSIQIDLDILG